MSEKKSFDSRQEWDTSLSEIRQGAIKYIEAILPILEKSVDASAPLSLGKEIIYMGYAMGVLAGKTSDVGIEGFTLVLSGMKISLQGEDRKEELQFAIWDKNGGLHTSEEAFRMTKGGEK